MQSKKYICWFSCGATSAIAAKLAVKKYKDKDLLIVYCDTRSEHPDNMRFLKDVESWINYPIQIIGSKKYNDIWDVFHKSRYLVGVKGARCTSVLKKRIRQELEKTFCPDFQIFGFDYGEENRADRFRKNNPEINLLTPIIDEKLDKETCLGLLAKNNIDIPTMYKLGFNNANCIGCPKGQGAYWNKIRECFPETFKKMALLERELNVAINKTYAGDGKRKRLFLDEMPEDFGRDSKMLNISCDLLCGMIDI